MAKGSEVNLIEKHLEKAVAGLCLLILVFAVFHWVLSPSRQVAVVGNGGMEEMVSPDQADSRLVETAKWIEQKVNGTKAPPVTLPDYISQFRSLQTQPFPYELEKAGDFGPPRIAIKSTGSWGPKPSPLALAELAKALPSPLKPLVRADRETVQKAESQDVLAAHITSVYPWSELAAKLNEKLQNSSVPLRMVPLRVESQVQALDGEGNWSEPQSVKPTVVVYSADGKQASEHNGEGMPVIPEFTGSNTADISQAIRTLTEAWQSYLLEPEYWNILWPNRQWGSWKLNLPKTDVSDQAGSGGTTPPAGVTPEMDPSAAPAAPSAPRGTTPRPADAAAAAPAWVPEAVSVPPLPAQMQHGRVQIWMHDANLEMLKTYRYRMRLVLLNPVLGYPDDVKDRKDAAVASVATPWSDWSDPVYSPRPTEFFLTGASPNNGTVSVTVFRHYKGQVVKKNFSVVFGQMIGGKAKVDIVNPADGKRTSEEVDLTTGAIAVDFDFSKRMIRNHMNQRTSEMLYLDDNGQLRSRIRVLDENDERYLRLMEESRAAAPTPVAGMPR